MPDTTTVTTSENICDTTKVTTETENNITTTTTNTHAKNCNETITKAPDPSTLTACCPCGKFDLNKLAEESRRCAFKSSNIALATSNAIVVFTMIVLQEILKQQCRNNTLNLDTIFLITSTIATLGDAVLINNPQPFNS